MTVFVPKLFSLTLMMASHYGDPTELLGLYIFSFSSP